MRLFSKGLSFRPLLTRFSLAPFGASDSRPVTCIAIVHGLSSYRLTQESHVFLTACRREAFEAKFPLRLTLTAQRARLQPSAFPASRNYVNIPETLRPRHQRNILYYTVCIYIYIYMYMYVCVYIYIYIHIHIYIITHIWGECTISYNTYIYIYIYIHIYIYI